MKVILSSIETALIDHWAKSVNDYGNKNGMISRKYDSRDDYALKVEGFGAELAVAKVLNVYPDLTLGYSKVDLTFYGQTINIKQTKYESGLLLIPEYQGKTADWYILCTGTPPEYTIRGAMHSEKVLTKERLQFFAKSMNYVVEQDELISMEDWIYGIKESSIKGD